MHDVSLNITRLVRVRLHMPQQWPAASTQLSQVYVHLPRCIEYSARQITCMSRMQDHPLPASLRSLQLGMDPESMAHHAALPRLTSLWSDDRSGVPVGNFDMLRVSERASRSALRHRLDEHREGEPVQPASVPSLMQCICMASC